MGARSNFEGGPSALSAGLTGRTPRYGYHLDAHRGGSKHFTLAHQPRGLADWGALGGIVGKATNSYWEVPVLTGLDAIPNSDELKHFGAALASFGSVALFHIPGVTPEAHTIAEAFAGRPVPPATRIERTDFEAFYATYAAPGDKADVVVFAAPQLSLVEMSQVARSARRPACAPGHFADRHHFARDQVRRRPDGPDAAHRGRRRHRRGWGGFYQSYAREMAEANRLAAPAHQLGQAGQHHRRLRLQAVAGQHGALHRQRGGGKDRLV